MDNITSLVVAQTHESCIPSPHFSSTRPMYKEKDGMDDMMEVSQAEPMASLSSV